MKTRMHRDPASMQRGVSLVELMVALLIGSILTLGLVEVFAASRTAYRVSEGIARVQENGRFALDYLQRDIRLIGHFGCANDQSHKQQVDAFGMRTGAAAGGPLDFNLSVEGFEANTTRPLDTLTLSAPTAGWTPALPAHISGLVPAPLPGSDVIMLRFLRANGAPVNAIAGNTITSTPGGWADLTDDGVAAPSVFAIADCSFVDVFTGAGNGGAATVTANAAPAVPLERYTPNPAGHAALYRAEAVAYYVANGANGPALHRTRWNAAGRQTEELVEGIESLQFLYGQDRSDVDNLSGFVNNQVTAATIGVATTTAGERAWRRVGLVQVGVVASSPDAAASRQAADANTRPRVLGVRVVGPDDSRLRTSYETTVALRNRLYGN